MGEPVGTRIIRDVDLPPNPTLKSKIPIGAVVPQEKERVKKKKVIKGAAVKRKKSLGKKFTETFLGESGKSVKEFIIHDVAIPSAKNLICDIFGWGGFAEKLLFGTTNGRRPVGANPARMGNAQYTPYGAITKPQITGGRQVVNNRATHNFDDIELVNRGDAEEVLGQLVDFTIDYGQATVADLYDLVGITSTFADNKYGWKDLSNASIGRVRNGYILNLPRTQVLE